ncbi:hypothetical protein HDU98_002747 [Podochytrium sp. JEL0797]|nr:hypothetical protein HDU98_002747 [Podochytrium sp. JEL0797]
MLALTLFITASCWILIYIKSIRDARNKTRASLESNETLKNQVFLLTGSSRGIGEQIAYKLAAQKAILILPVRSIPNSLVDLIHKCRQLGSPRVHALMYDASDHASCVKVVGEALSLEKRLDGVILNHATSVFEPLFQMFKEDQTKIIRATMEANYFGFVTLALEALPHLQKTAREERKSAALVVVGSLAGRVAGPFVHAYSASKHAIDGFFNCLRHELAMVPDNRVVLTNCVLGAIGTQNFFDTVSVRAKSVVKLAVTPEETAQRILESIMGKEEQFYFPAYIQAQYVMNALSHRFGFKANRLAHGL